MTPRCEARTFLLAAFGLWLLFVVQAAHSPILLDDWFQIRYWRDHDFTLPELWAYARHNYHHYNPRIGEVFLAIVDGSLIIHVIVTPIVQLALLPITFAIAFGRWPKRTLRDLQLLLFIQTMIWLVVPIPGMIYFYRPLTTNYLWAFTITLALFVPYRLAAASAESRRRLWLVPIMFVAGWTAGMCNEHTGPAAMVAMAAFIYMAWRTHRLRAWMLAGMLGLYLGYPMLFFAPGQTVRYGGIAAKDTPIKLLADRGITGCLSIVRDFLYDARLGLLLVLAAAIAYTLAIRRPPWPRLRVEAALLAIASAAIVMTLFVSPTASDRVFFASGILLVATLAIVADQLLAERLVRRMLLGACIVIFGYHVLRFVEHGVAVKAENDARIALLRATRPGTVAVVPSYSYVHRSRWHLGDDFHYYPWLRDYVGGELFDTARVDVDRRSPAPAPRLLSLPLHSIPPSYRELQAMPNRPPRTIVATGLFDDPQTRPILVQAGDTFVDGRPHDEARGHFIRIHRETMPDYADEAYVIGCNLITQVVLVVDDERADPLVPVDERFCRGPFTAVLCERDACWVAGWY